MSVCDECLPEAAAMRSIPGHVSPALLTWRRPMAERARVCAAKTGAGPMFLLWLQRYSCADVRWIRPHPPPTAATRRACMCAMATVAGSRGVAFVPHHYARRAVH